MEKKSKDLYLCVYICVCACARVCVEGAGHGKTEK